MEYICKHCNKSYKSMQSRGNHYRIYHKNVTTNPTILPQNPTISPQNSTILPQKNICKYCKKELSRMDSLHP